MSESSRIVELEERLHELEKENKELKSKISIKLHANQETILNSLDIEQFYEDSRRQSLDLYQKKIPLNFEGSTIDDRKKFGNYMMFVNREREVNKMLKHLKKNYSLFRNKCVSKDFLCVPGAPGIGKSTFIRKSIVAATSEANNNKYWNDLDEVFKNRMKVTVEKGLLFFIPMDEVLEPNAFEYCVVYFLAFLLSRHAANKSPVNERELRSQIVDSFIQRNYDIGSLVRETFRFLVGKTDETEIIVINFDEMNQVNDAFVRLPFIGAVVTAVLNYLSSEPAPNYPFVYMTFSGTNTLKLPDIVKNVSSVEPFLLSLPLLEINLDINHGFDVINDIFNRIKKSNNIQCNDLKCSKTLNCLLLLFGRVPRYLECLIFALGCTDRNPFNAEIFFNRVQSDRFDHKDVSKLTASFVMDYYSTAYSKVLSATLLCYSLFDCEVSRNSLIGTYNLAELEQDGVLFLESIPNSVKFTISIPLILMRKAFKSLSQFNKMSPHLLCTDETGTPKDYEFDDLKVLNLKMIYCSSKSGSNTILLSDVFPLEKFTKLKKSLKNKTIQLPKDVEFIESPRQLASKDFQNPLAIKANYGGKSVKNCDLASGPDSAFVDIIGFPLFFQTRRLMTEKDKAIEDQTIGELTAEGVRDEHAKISTNVDHIFVYITDKAFREYEKLSDDEIVIDVTLMKSYTGKLLSMLRAFDVSHKEEILSYEWNGLPRVIYCTLSTTQQCQYDEIRKTAIKPALKVKKLKDICNFGVVVDDEASTRQSNRISQSTEKNKTQFDWQISNKLNFLKEVLICWRNLGCKKVAIFSRRLKLLELVKVMLGSVESELSKDINVHDVIIRTSSINSAKDFNSNDRFVMLVAIEFNVYSDCTSIILDCDWTPVNNEYTYRILCAGTVEEYFSEELSVSKTMSVPEYNDINANHMMEQTKPVYQSWHSENDRFSTHNVSCVSNFEDDEVTITAPIGYRIATGVVGLKNLHNNCYANALIQCLSNTILKDSLIKFNGTGALIQAFAKILKEIWSCQHPQFDPREFLNIMFNTLTDFTKELQHDAFELLRYLLNDIQQHREMYDMMTVNFTRTITCENCQHISASSDDNLYLILPIPPSQVTTSSSAAAIDQSVESIEQTSTLVECIQYYIQNEPLSSYNCELCKKGKCSRSIKLNILPSLLVICLSRFTNDYKVKINKLVNYPVLLHANEFSEFTDVYELKAVCNHIGSTPLYGHYVACARSAANDSWYSFDDGKVAQIDIRGFLKSDQVYLLFYEKQTRNHVELDETDIHEEVDDFIATSNQQFVETISIATQDDENEVNEESSPPAKKMKTTTSSNSSRVEEKD